jgi:hypothetical protein
METLRLSVFKLPEILDFDPMLDLDLELCILPRLGRPEGG